jgi:5-deoxy-glucuronate isomerase
VELAQTKSRLERLKRCDERRDTVDTMRLRYTYQPAPGYTQLVTPQTHPVERLDFGVLRLATDATYTLEAGEDEVGLVILSGGCDIHVDGEEYVGLGERASVFEGRATGVYAPREARVEIVSASDDLEIAVCRAPATHRFPARVIRPAQVVAREVGGTGFRRYVHDILGPQIEADSLLIGETFTIAGNWSSFPPHKHDVEALPDEVGQEELYLFKLRPANGFGLQYFYTSADSPHGALDEAVAVHDNDLTLMPFGYHPVAAPPGYDVYYLWFLSGATRLMRPHDDPAHAWIKSAPDEPRTYPQ